MNYMNYFKLLVIPFLMSTQLASAELAQPTTDSEKLSYSFGYNIGNSLQRQETELNADYLFRGIQDVLNGSESMLTEDEVRTVLVKYQQDRMAEEEAKQRQAADENKEAGETFLGENAKKEGVVTLASGLQYKVITEGSGKSPTKDDTVTVHYKGTLLDGSEFDSSYKRGQPASFPVSGVIAGWTQALQLMKEGAKWQLFIPSGLAYGPRGSGGAIGPNETLIFEVELLQVGG